MNIGEILDFPRLIYRIVKDPKFLTAILFLSAALLFLPNTFLSRLGVTEIVNSLRPWVGFVFLISCAFLFAIFVFGTKDLLAKKLRERRESKYVKEHLRMLSGDEKRFLSDYVIRKKITQNAPLGSGVANSLVCKGIVYQASNVGHILNGIAFNLQSCAREELNKHPELLEPELSTLRKELNSGRRSRY